MAVYLGSSKKLNINLNGIKYYFNFYSMAPIFSSAKLLSSEGYILKDSNGLYLIAKEGV